MLRLSILFAASLLTVPLTATAPRGYQIRDTVVRSDAAGARIHEAVSAARLSAAADRGACGPFGR